MTFCHSRAVRPRCFCPWGRVVLFSNKGTILSYAVDVRRIYYSHAVGSAFWYRVESNYQDCINSVYAFVFEFTSRRRFALAFELLITKVENWRKFMNFSFHLTVFLWIPHSNEPGCFILYPTALNRLKRCLLLGRQIRYIQINHRGSPNFRMRLFICSFQLPVTFSI